VDLSRLSLPGLRADLKEHLDVVGALEVVHEQQSLGLGLAEGILELMSTIGGIDIDHDYARLGRGKLGDDPFGKVCGPDGQAVALPEAQSHEALGGAVQLFLQLAIGVAFLLMN